jgi:NTE family protein
VTGGALTTQTQDPVGRRRLMVALALLPAGCAVNTDEDHNGEDAPGVAPLPRTPRVAWVFSSGGPRGFVHVGVIKALDELGLAPDLLVGASVGSVVATLRAAGFTGLEMERLVLELNPLSLARVANLLGGGGGSKGSERLSGAPVAELIRMQLQRRAFGTRLEALPIMTVCVAQRLAEGGSQSVGFTQGDAGLAVQASCAIEGQFTPVRIRTQHYADADKHLPLPVRMARQLGATRVFAVDASAHENQAPPEAHRYRNSDLRKRANTLPDALSADLTLQPQFGYWVSLSTEFRLRAIEAGYRETLAQAEQIRRIHAA